MLNKIKSKLNSPSPKELTSTILEELNIIRKNQDTIVLYGSPTGSNWLGIKNATTSLFSKNSIEIPQVYSRANISTKIQKTICLELKKLKFKKVIFSGFANYFFDWIDWLYDDIQIETIYHGTISEFHETDTQKYISRLIEYSHQKKIARIGFIKKGLSEIFKKIYKIDTYHQKLNNPIIPKQIKKLILDRSKVHIGVFGSNNFNKNIHNQVIHALMIENSIVHVLDKSVFQYLKMNNRIIGHGKNLKSNVFLGILGSMDLNLYMSYSESWGLIKYESEKMGVPCINIDEINYNTIIKNSIK